jgi:hypothetical protein
VGKGKSGKKDNTLSIILIGKIIKNFMKENAIKRVIKIVTPKKDFTLANTLTWAKSSV